MSAESVYSVVVSGGTGTRLWPVSREGLPKPFMKISDGETLIGKTYSRVKALCSEVLTVTNRDYYFMSRDELDLVGLTGNFLLEPFGRNTAPAIALAAKYVSFTKGSDTVMLVLPADHLITDNSEFAAAVERAAKLANDDYLVTFGIVPNAPETGFGYIKKGESLGGAPNLSYKVAQFVEKPNHVIAKEFFNSGNYLWNSGIFCFKANVFLEELNKTAPELFASVDSCWNSMQHNINSDMIQIPSEQFLTVPDISIDYAVMEKSSRVAVISNFFAWNDIGSWRAIRDLVHPDKSNNRSLGEAIFVDTQNTFVHSQDRLVATLGISDTIIVDTPDALLIAHSDKIQDVKKVVAQLKNDNHEAFKLHRTTVRPWGAFTVLEQGNGFKIKRIEVKPGASLSLQMHHHRSEHWIVVKGTAKITNGESETLVQVNESTYIPVGQKHRLENTGIVPCVMIEVQCGSYLGEDDIVRFDDMYGR